MNKLLYLIGIVLFVVCAASCNNDYINAEGNNVSLRDDVYSGNRLIVKMDRNVVTGVTATIQSEWTKTDTTLTSVKDSLGNQILQVNPHYNTTVTLTNFPTKGKAFVLSTISTVDDFKGETTIEGKQYEYEGVFTGDPLDLHQNQGCEIYFTQKK